MRLYIFGHYFVIQIIKITLNFLIFNLLFVLFLFTFVKEATESCEPKLLKKIKLKLIWFYV